MNGLACKDWYRISNTFLVKNILVKIILYFINVRKMVKQYKKDEVLDNYLNGAL